MSNVLTDYKPPAKKPATKKAMAAYLAGHPRYNTANANNRATSYSRCIKLHHVTFPDKGAEEVGWDLVCSDTNWWHASGVARLLREFDTRWNHSYQVGTNGRSGGYLVVYTGHTKASEWKSYCEACGQQNFTRADPEPGVCGRCRAEERYNYDAPQTEVVTFPYRGLDEDRDFAEWDKDRLAARVETVWDFDRTAEAAAAAFVAFCGTHVLSEEVVTVRKKVKVIRARPGKG